MATDTTSTRLRLGLDDHGRATTAAEYLGAEFDEPWRYELRDGRLAVMSPAGEDHVATTQPWLELLMAYRLAHPARVDRVAPEAWVRIDDENYRIGDLGVYLRGERSGLRIPERAPELIFEFVSPGRMAHDRDYVEKRSDYHAAGVREYVIVDPLAARVIVLTDAPGRYAERVLRAGEAYATPLLPDLAVPLAGIFR
jgi:Uma2 family endonuclease